MPNEESKQIRTIFIVIMLVGLLVFLIGLALSIKMLVLDRVNSVSTKAIITKITSNSTSVEYTVNNKIYRKTFSAYSSTYREGQELKVYYNKANPYKSYIAGLRYLILIVPGIGILLMGISGIGFIYIYTKYYSKYR